MPIQVQLDTILGRDESILESDIGDEKVMMSIALGRFWGTNAMGRQVYDLCDGKRRLEQLCELLMDQFDVDAETCQREVLAFAQRAVERGLLVVV